jgi:hypothetical protein
LLAFDVSVIVQGEPGSGRSVVLSRLARFLPACTYTLAVVDAAHAHVWEGVAEELIVEGDDAECATAVQGVLTAANDSWFTHAAEAPTGVIRRVIAEAAPRFRIVVEQASVGPLLRKALASVVERGRHVRVSLLWAARPADCRGGDVDYRLTMGVESLPPFSALVERASNPGVPCVYIVDGPDDDDMDIG